MHSGMKLKTSLKPWQALGSQAEIWEELAVGKRQTKPPRTTDRRARQNLASYTSKVHQVPPPWSQIKSYVSEHSSTAKSSIGWLFLNRSWNLFIYGLYLCIFRTPFLNPSRKVLARKLSVGTLSCSTSSKPSKWSIFTSSRGLRTLSRPWSLRTGNWRQFMHSTLGVGSQTAIDLTGF